MTDTDDALKRLRRELGELREEIGYREADVRFAVLTAALAAVVLALTAAPWFTDDDGDLTDQVNTAWGATDLGFFGLLSLVLVLTAASATLGYAAVSGATPTAHWVLCGLCAAGGLVPAFLPLAVDDAAITSGVGLWLTVVAALVLAGMHGTHADVLRGRQFRL